MITESCRKRRKLSVKLKLSARMTTSLPPNETDAMGRRVKPRLNETRRRETPGDAGRRNKPTYAAIRC
jgi:hypothetical protein